MFYALLQCGLEFPHARELSHASDCGAIIVFAGGYFIIAGYSNSDIAAAHRGYLLQATSIGLEMEDPRNAGRSCHRQFGHCI